MPWPSSADDPALKLIRDEEIRQNSTIQLIASENFASPATMAATGSVLTNKYSEGYPGKRYYGGNMVVDQLEDLARDRICEVFGADHANVQPHAGAIANMGVYQARLEPGDTILGLSLDHGGHLTHGSPVNFSGLQYNFVSYGVTASDERIDMDEVRAKAHEHKPKLIVAGATAYPRIIDPAPFREIADEVGALLMFDAAHIAGLLAGGVHPNPMPYVDVMTFPTHKTLRGPRGGCILSRAEHAAKAIAFGEVLDPLFKAYAQQVVANAAALAEALAGHGFRLCSGGTDNHLLLVDLRTFDAELTGKEAQAVLDDAGISLNKNTVPDDPRSPFVTSGVRIGTPAITTQGMGTEEMAIVADLIARALRNRDDATVVAGVKMEAEALCARFQPYPERGA